MQNAAGGGAVRSVRRVVCVHAYDDIISVENLLVAWREFLRGKRKRKDVEEFSVYLMDNIFVLHRELANKTYRHGGYTAFKINDPKPRDIHKASVRDRLLHHALYRVLYPYFDQKFIHDSYSCRNRKGTHKAIDQFRKFARIVSKNNTRTCFVLKCDIRKFFASIDHEILEQILAKHIEDRDILWLLAEVVESFHAAGKLDVGLPLGNLTSQLLVNVYMNEFDHFVKRRLKAKYYIRYADDFVFLHQDKRYLEKLIPEISKFLEGNLKLSLHANKTFVKTFTSGVDFLGWVHFFYNRVPRPSTKKRIFKKLSQYSNPETIVSYLGLLSHGDTYNMARKIRNAI